MEHLNGQLTLEIGGAKRTLFFTNTTVSILTSLVPDGNYEEVLAKNPFRTLPMITYAALLAGDDVNDLPEGLTERQVDRWLMNTSQEDIQKILPLYKHSMGFIIAAMQAASPQPEEPAKSKKPIIRATQ